MKKVIVFLMVSLMLLSLFNVTAFAEERGSETIHFAETKNVETEHLKLVAVSYGHDGWRGGDDKEKLTITAKDKNMVITRIEAVISVYGSDYDEVGITFGTKRETGQVADGSIVHIDNINNNTFSFSEGNTYAKFKDITVFYDYGATNENAASNDYILFKRTNNVETEHFILSAGAFDDDGWYGGKNIDHYKLTITAKDKNITITRIEAVMGHFGWNYDGVGISSGTKRETGKVEDGSIVKIDNINSNTFSFSGGDYYAQFKDIAVFYEYGPKKVGSAISDGDIWIIVGIVAIAAAAILVVTKKRNKLALADGAEKEVKDEE